MSKIIFLVLILISINLICCDDFTAEFKGKKVRVDPSGPNLGTPAQYRGYNYSAANCDGYTVNYNPSSDIKLVFIGQYLQRFTVDPSNYARVHRLGCYLKSLDADYIFSDAEEAIWAPVNTTERSEEFINDSVPSVAETAILDILTQLYGITMVTVANNHFFDLGPEGFQVGLQQLKLRNIPYVGAGQNVSEASSPKYFPTRNPEKIIGVHAAVSAPTLNTFGGIATDSRPGLNAMQLDSQANPTIIDPVALQRQYDRIQEACEKADIVVSVHHNHFNNRTNPFNRLAWETDYRHGVIDSGASFYMAHGSAMMLGVESYKGALIFHNLGSLVFQTTNLGGYQPDLFESVIAQVTLDRDTTRIEDVTFWPVGLNGYPADGTAPSNPAYFSTLGFPGYIPTAGQPANLFATPEQGMAILYRFKGMSSELGSQIEIDDQTVSARLVMNNQFVHSKPDARLGCRRFRRDHH